MKTGGLDRLISRSFENMDAPLAVIKKQGGMLAGHAHFEFSAIDSDGRRVRYQLSTGDTGAVEVVRRRYK